MRTKRIKKYSLSELKDTHIGKVGTQERDEYEVNLELEIQEADDEGLLSVKKIRRFRRNHNCQKVFRVKIITFIKLFGFSLYNY